MKSILISASDSGTQETIKTFLSNEYNVETAPSARQSLEMLQNRRYEFFFVDISHLPEIGPEDSYTQGYKSHLQTLWKINPSVEIIILCSHSNIRNAVDAVRSGAGNYLAYPVDNKELKYIIETAIEATRAQFELDYFRDQFWDSDSLRVVSTRNKEMKEIFRKVKSAAPSNMTVLITGETGTGKGVLAKLIHAHSQKKEKQFISLHCGAIPENLIESELFGHEKGAFTGASKRKLGKFEIARDGTLFLDEISTMPLSSQVKLLQVLQEKSFQRVGGEDTIRIDTRIIAASNNNLEELTKKGEFRHDLFYRLNVFPIHLPPLRNRMEDIPLMAEEFLHRLNKAHSKNIKGLHPDVLKAFSNYKWPGNIREMENLMERAYILEASNLLSPESFPNEIFTGSESHTEIFLNTDKTLSQVRRQNIQKIESIYLKELLQKHRGRIDATAKAAGISARQLHKLLTKYIIKKEKYKRDKKQD